MSLKQLLGLNGAGITEAEIMSKIREAQQKDLDSVEFDVDGDVIKIFFPHGISKI